jgi:hypothetical protein
MLAKQNPQTIFLGLWYRMGYNTILIIKKQLMIAWS